MSRAAAGEPVHESDRLRVTFRPAGGAERPLVVTFDSLSPDLRLQRPGFGEAWLAQVGYDAVHVVSAGNDWYGAPDLREALARVRALAAGRARTVTYGSSMGGYAAVRFAGRAGAQAAVALSPQVSIDPVKAPWENRWSDYATGLDFGWETPAPEDEGLRTAYVVYDPYGRDRLHMEALASLLPVTPVPVRYAGHPSGTFLAETHLLADMVLDMVEDRFDLAAFRTEVRRARRRSAAYHQVLADGQPVRRAGLALRLTQEAARLSPHAGVYHRALGDRLDRAGDPAGAEAALRTALALEPDQPNGRLRLAELLAERGGDRREVRALVEDLRGRGAVREALFVRVVDLLFIAGEFEAAAEEARAALAHLPGSRALRLRALALRGALRLPMVGPAALRIARRAARARLGDGRRSGTR